MILLSEKAEQFLHYEGYRQKTLLDTEKVSFKRTEGRCDVTLTIHIITDTYFITGLIETDKESLMYTSEHYIRKDSEYIVGKDEFESVIDIINENLPRMKW